MVPHPTTYPRTILSPEVSKGSRKLLLEELDQLNVRALYESDNQDEYHYDQRC